MQNFKNLKQELAITETLGQITNIYEEIYLMRVRQTRGAVLQNRNFMESLRDVFTEVKLLYGGVLLQNRKMLQARKGPNSKQNVAVLLSSSKKFTGEVTQRVFLAFSEYARQNRCDLVVVGKSGYDLFKGSASAMPEQRALYFEDLGASLLLPILRQYATVSLFYGKFVSLVKQEANTQTVKEVDYSSLAKQRSAKSAKSFIVEPEVATVADFFEQELFDAFYRQAAQESTLASLGSSIAQLEEATNNTEERLGYLHQANRRQNRLAANRRQLNTLPSVVFAAEGGL